MRINLNPFLTVILILLCAGILAGTDKENKFSDYSPVYNDNEYVVLKKNNYSSNSAFIPKPEHGKLIRDSVAEAEIRMYREKNPGSTRYIDFNFNSLLGYISKFQNVENALDNMNLGVRVYPAIDLHTKQLTVIISPTKNDRALWINKNMSNGRLSDTINDIEAFNTGSACPFNCPDSDTLSIPR